VKTGLFRILSTLAAVVFLIAGYFAAEFFHQTRSTALAHSLVTDITQSLLGSADAAPLLALADDGINLSVPDLTPLERFGELIVMDAPTGAVFVPPLFSGVTGSASLQLRASFAYGTADVAAELEYRAGAWHLRNYVLTPGSGVM
jgi:hypothetical protein